MDHGSTSTGDLREDKLQPGSAEKYYKLYAGVKTKVFTYLVRRGKIERHLLASRHKLD